MADDHGHLSATVSGGAHSAKALNNANLSAALQDFVGADRVFFADLNELNNSNAEGGALLLLKGGKLTVITAARGVEPDQIHPQHIHGFEDGRDAMVPTLAQDDDRDGFIELAEGLDTYGPILLNLTSPPGPDASGFPKPSGSSFLFSQTYDLDDPKNGDLAKLLDDVSLSRREIVLHGLTLDSGFGAGTGGEVDGTAGYKIVLPIASGEIRELSVENALQEFQSAVSLHLGRTIEGTTSSEFLNGGRGNETIFGRAGNDLVRGGEGDDFLSGGAGSDSLYGQRGDDNLAGGTGNDKLFGNSGKDYLAGGSGSDQLFGGTGHDHLEGGAGNDRLNGGLSHDVLAGSLGNDAFVFDTALNSGNVDTILDFGRGNDAFRLDNAVFTGLSTGSLSAGAFALSSAMAGADDRIIYDDSTGDLFFDPDGGSRDNMVQFARLENKAVLSAGDFFVF